MDDGVFHIVESTGSSFGNRTILLPKRERVGCYQGRDILNGQILFCPHRVSPCQRWIVAQVAERVGENWEYLNFVVRTRRLLKHTFLAPSAMT